MSAQRRRAALIALLLAPFALQAQAHAQAHARRAPTLTSSASAGSSWFERGRALSISARHRESVAAFERAIQLGECEPGVGAWQVARAYAQLGNRKQALRWRQHALDFGFDDRRAMEDDAELLGMLHDASRRAPAEPRRLVRSDEPVGWSR